MDKKIRVLIADDIKILRQGLKAILMQDDSIEVVGAAENGHEAFEMAKSLKPDVVLMDMRMPDYDGAYGIRAIKEKLLVNDNPIKVLVLTTFDDEETINKAVQSGADGYILKEMEDEKIVASVKSVYSGISVFGEGVFASMRSKLNTPTQNNTSSLSFTDRELDVMKLVANGYDNKEIAGTLFLAEGTVRNQISHLLEKTGLKDRTQLAVYAVKNGLD